jgi:hypothetical protein
MPERRFAGFVEQLLGFRVKETHEFMRDSFETMSGYHRTELAKKLIINTRVYPRSNAHTVQYSAEQSGFDLERSYYCRESTYGFLYSYAPACCPSNKNLDAYTEFVNTTLYPDGFFFVPAMEVHLPECIGGE